MLRIGVNGSLSKLQIDTRLNCEYSGWYLNDISNADAWWETAFVHIPAVATGPLIQTVRIEQ